MTKILKVNDVRGRIDFVVITIREDEFQAVLNRFQPVGSIFGGRQAYQYCELRNAESALISCAVTRSYGQGTVPAALCTQYAIEDLSPKWLVLTGIAGAVPDSEFTLGDVLLADTLVDFTVSAVIEGRPREYRTSGGSMEASVERLLSALPAFREILGDWSNPSKVGRARPQILYSDDITDDRYYGSDDDRQKVRAAFAHHFGPGNAPRLPKFTMGAVASSDELVKSTGDLRSRRAIARQITHIEMELAGAYQAARRARPRELPLLSVRGISDVVGFKRADEWTEFACLIASSFLHSLVTRIPLSAFEFQPSLRTSVLLDLPPERSEQSLATVISAFATSSAALNAWVVQIDDRIPRSELEDLLTRSEEHSGRVLCLLGSPGSGKTSILALLAQLAANAGIATLALKADLLPSRRALADWGNREFGLEMSAIEAVRAVAAIQPVLVVVDQLDALSAVVAINTTTFNEVVEFLLECAKLPHVSVVCSCRDFDFRHDSRFALLEADEVTLSLPSWEDVATQLERHGVVGAANWPTAFRDLLRTPQHLHVYLEHFKKTGRNDPFASYHLMLDSIWNEQIHSTQEARVLDQLTVFLIDHELLWAPLSEFSDFAGTILSLESKGLLAAQEGKVGFAHQTLFEHAKARLFVGLERSFSSYVLERQKSLQVRPTIWAVLQYLRDTSTQKYRTEIEGLLSNTTRLHIRYLLIDFLSQQNPPLDFEIKLLGTRLRDPEDSTRVLVGIRSNSGYFTAFQDSHFPEYMRDATRTQWPMVGVLNEAWDHSHGKCFDLVREFWFPNPDFDELTERVIAETGSWGGRELELARQLVGRKPEGRSFWAENLVSVLGAAKPEYAPYLFIDTIAATADGSRNPIEYEQRWYNLSTVAEAVPFDFLRVGWAWFVATSEEHSGDYYSTQLFRYTGYSFGLSEEPRSHRPPVLEAFVTAIDGLAKSDPVRFIEVTRPTWISEDELVQRLIMRGITILAVDWPEMALSYLTGDRRRFALGDNRGYDQSDSLQLIRVIAPKLLPHELRQLETLIANWSQYRDGIDLCESQIRWDREARLRLFCAIPPDLQSEDVRLLVETEKSELKDWEPEPRPRIRSGFVNHVPPMTHTEMAAAGEHEIVDRIISADGLPTTKIEVPGGWEQSGTAVDGSRELAQLNKTDPAKVARTIIQLVAAGHETAAAAAFNGLSESTLDSTEILQFVRTLAASAPRDTQLRREIAYLMYRRGQEIPEDITNLLHLWLLESATNDPEPHDVIDTEKQAYRSEESSVLWGNAAQLRINSTSRSFWILLAVTAARLRANPPQYAEWIGELEACVAGNIGGQTWAHFCSSLSDLRFAGDSQTRGVRFIESLLQKFPILGSCRDGLILLANISDIMDEKNLRNVLGELKGADKTILRQAYGELLALIAFRDDNHHWARQELEMELAKLSGTIEWDESPIAGIAYAAANLWDEVEFRPIAAETLARIIPYANRKVGSSISQVFQARDDFAKDESTLQLLNALAAHPSSLAVIRLQDLVPHLVNLIPEERRLVLSLCQSMLQTTNNPSELYESGAQLVNISLTLQRFPDTQDEALTFFERLLHLGLDAAVQVLKEVDVLPTSVARRPARDRIRRRRRHPSP